ncbi:putative aquaporin 6 [Ephemerocybe angulata]|uniref:Putative aquaporin 6 n=1 Tax=Ephemerocybe angulata TaxID=980116 RepID=A0A8H6I554_9AGAR|nr:putative aquaporin 6 [Tulosesus angulatus]
MKNPSFDSAEKDVSDVQHYEKAPPSSSVRSEPTSAMGQGGRTYRKAPFAWIQFREDYRQYFAEYFGTMILILFGNGVNCQTVLTKAGAAGNWNTINTGWGVGTAMGVWVSAGISGGHINPAVTLALATYRGFPWRKVPGYILAQVLGAFTAAALVYANYFHALDVFEGGSMVRTELTRGLFSTYAQPYMSNVSCFFDEFLGTFILVMVVLAIGDKKNCPPPAGLAPLVLYFLILGIGNSWGIETAYAINPARDFGPRLLTAAAGYGRGVWTYRHHYWIWCPILAPILGAQAAAWTYDTFLYSGTDSVITKRLVYDDEPTHEGQMSREEKV